MIVPGVSTSLLQLLYKKVAQPNYYSLLKFIHKLSLYLMLIIIFYLQLNDFLSF